MEGYGKGSLIYVRDKERLKEISEELGMPMAKVVGLGAEVLHAILRDDYLFYVFGNRLGYLNPSLVNNLMKYRLKYLRKRRTYLRRLRTQIR